jgi:hypothetical protein
MRNMTFEEEIDCLIAAARRDGMTQGPTSVDLDVSEASVLKARNRVLVMHAKVVRELSRMTDDYNRVCDEYA